MHLKGAILLDRKSYMRGGQGCRCILLACLPLLFATRCTGLENGQAIRPPMGVNTWNGECVNSNLRK